MKAGCLRGIIAAIVLGWVLPAGEHGVFLRAQGGPAAAAAGEVSPDWRISQVSGRVLVRSADGRNQVPAQETHALPAGGVLISGANSRVELVAGGGIWRIGSLGVWQALPDGARVLAGSALAVVPPGTEQAVEALGGSMRLGPGTWMLTAVENEGLKVLCFSSEGILRASAGSGNTVREETTRRLRAGELVFLRPAGRGFGPVLTIFLAESLGTSRLVHGFSRPLPNLKELQLVAAVQSDRLAAVSKALVAGAKDQAGFQVMVAEPPEARKQPVRRAP
jgi:hypothetical protein